MRNLHELDHWRRKDRVVLEWYGNIGDGTCGVFDIPSNIDRAVLTIIASSGEGWEHVSVSRRNRCPNWLEMDYIKRLFFKDDEVCMQLHVAVTEHISVHPNCLHIWRPRNAEIPLPPAVLVA